MPLKLLYVARYSPEKRHRYLFKVLSQLSIPFELTLIGTGCTYNNKLFRKALEHYKINALCFEHVENIFEYYEKSTYTLLFSSSEAFPNVLAESMMLGTPCISFNVGDAALIIGNCGYILPNKSFQSVCLKLHEAALSANTSEYRDMREAARLRFKSLFTLEEMACSYNLIYSSNCD